MKYRPEWDELWGGLYLGDAIGLAAFVKTIADRYIYILHRPDGMPFYVGQGKVGRGVPRALQHVSEARLPAGAKVSNPFKCNVIRSLTRQGLAVGYRIDSLHDSQESVDARERELIALIGRFKDGGPLTNLVAGGGGASDPAPESKERHRKTLSGIPDEEGDRRTVNRVLTTFEPDRGSIAIKPVSEFLVHTLTPFLPSEKKATAGVLTVRAAMALGVSAAINGVELVPGCQIPRQVEIEGVPAVIENGVGRRILASQVVEIQGSLGEEVFLPSAVAIEQIISAVGRERLEGAGVLSGACQHLNRRWVPSPIQGHPGKKYCQKLSI